MAQLTAPHTRHHASFVAAMEELRAEGRGEPDDDSTIGRDIRKYHGRWEAPEVFAGYVARVRAQDAPGAVLPQGVVPCTTLWYIDGDTFIGRLAVRHTLTDWLREYGGHIGYDVRPTARRRGHGTAMLAAALPVARSLGIDSALVTCDTGNTASRRVVEACGGVLEDERGGKLRYWVPTGP